MAFEIGNQFGKKSKRGSAKETKNLRNHFLQLLENNSPQMQKDLDDLEPVDRLKMMLSIASYVIPKLKAVEHTDRDINDRKVVVSFVNSDGSTVKDFNSNED